MSVPVRPLQEVTAQAFTILVREMGLADTVRFVNQFSSGYGDYTAEREALFADTGLEQILKALERARSSDQAA